jgi:hypothetical protein
MPVYKESLEQTIAPSVESLKKAVRTYARQGGTSSIMVNDDGLQLLSRGGTGRPHPVLRQPRYRLGCPPSARTRGLPYRAGRFKKASNMNYGLSLSLRMEEILCELEGGPGSERERIR